MNQVSRAELTDDLTTAEANVEEMLAHMMEVHYSCQDLGATPLKYQTFIEQYRYILQTKREQQGGHVKHLVAGLQKL